MTDKIKKRIGELADERASLEAIHNAMIQQNQKLNQEFQAAVTRNQTRFAQLTGAIDELTKLITPSADKPNERTDNHDDSIPTPDSGYRAVDVCIGQQPQGR